MSNTADKRRDSRSGGNGAMIALVIVLIAVVLIVFFVMIFVIMKNKGKDAPAGETAAEQTQRREVVSEDVRVVLDEDSGQAMMEQMREEVAEGMFECQMSMDWTFDDGKAESRDAYVGNSTNNTHPICFDVIMDGTEEVVYSSPVLPVGAELTNFKLDKELPAGDYQATVMYKLLTDAESQEEISSAGFVVNIKVLN
jgi:hypothetical protein